ncbi:hypothetical protein ACQKCH_18495 [Nubsella zeaxanthinifaciens]|uniref:hypothetical protein n=1 Tax=Nubsella zeaxanthinifaciens TaxID=392412 RepID=UPI003D045222
MDNSSNEHPEKTNHPEKSIEDIMDRTAGLRIRHQSTMDRLVELKKASDSLREAMDHDADGQHSPDRDSE